MRGTSDREKEREREREREIERERERNKIQKGASLGSSRLWVPEFFLSVVLSDGEAPCCLHKRCISEVLGLEMGTPKSWYPELQRTWSLAGRFETPSYHRTSNGSVGECGVWCLGRLTPHVPALLSGFKG